MKTTEKENGRFGELIRYTAAGYIGGLGCGILLDHFGFKQNWIGQWIVRTLSGEGESIFEGFYAIRQRMRRVSGSMAEAYGWGKLAGMTVPWIVDWISRLAGVNVNGAEGFYIPYFYALSDQIGGNVSGLVFLRRREKSWGKAVSRYSHNPVMMVSLAVILFVPVGLLAVRLIGFSPTTQTSAALETMAANLCWVPPLTGWLMERGTKK